MIRILGVIGLALLALVLWVRRRQGYFKRRNIPFYRSVPFLGAFADCLLAKVGIYENVEKIYNCPGLKDEPFYGIFLFHKPALMITDPEMIKRILVKDFTSFSNRHTSSDVHDPLGHFNVFAVKNPMWRTLRGKLSPFFSSGKLKLMFYILDKLSSNMIDNINQRLDVNGSVELEVKDFSGCYSTDVIASCAFGVEANSLENPNGEFRSIGKHIFNFTTRRGLEFTSLFMLPEVAKLFNIKMFTAKGTDFIRRTITDIMNERVKSGGRRNDLIDTLIEIKKSDERMSMDMLFAQAASFFTAGLETSSITMTFALYEMAKRRNIQQRVRDEVRAMMLKYDGETSYDGVMHETPYLHRVIEETLRLYPVLPLLDRECSNPDGYSLDGFRIPHKMPIYIPIYPLQRDEKFFDDPLAFNPDRFAADTNPFANLPFGNGPRNCIGERFGLMQVKTGLVKILKSFRLEMTSSTPKQIRFAKRAMLIQPDKPLYLKFVKEVLV